MTKQGALSINVLIVAVLGILVLILLAFVLTSGVGNLNESTSCFAANGVCVAADNCDTQYRISLQDGTSSQELCRSGNNDNDGVQVGSSGQNQVCCQPGRTR